MKAAIYLGTPTGTDNEPFNAEEIDACRKWVLGNGHTVATNHLFSKVNDMLIAASNRSFQIVYVFNLGGIGTNVTDVLSLSSTLEKYHVLIVFVSDHPGLDNGQHPPLTEVIKAMVAKRLPKLSMR